VGGSSGHTYLVLPNQNFCECASYGFSGRLRKSFFLLRRQQFSHSIRLGITPSFAPLLFHAVLKSQDSMVRSRSSAVSGRETGGEHLLLNRSVVQYAPFTLPLPFVSLPLLVQACSRRQASDTARRPPCRLQD
jgi:hypothetical protein